MNKNTPEAKGIRTAFQAIIGAVITFFTGLWAIPEVQEYVRLFVQNEGKTLLFVMLAAFGVSAGLISFIQNKLGR